MKAKTTDQKIRLPVEVLEKLKQFAIQVSVHRKKQVTWSDILRFSAIEYTHCKEPEEVSKSLAVRMAKYESWLAKQSPTQDTGEGKSTARN